MKSAILYNQPGAAVNQDIFNPLSQAQKTIMQIIYIKSMSCTA